MVAATWQQVHYPVCGLIIGAQTNGSSLIPDTASKKSSSAELRGLLWMSELSELVLFESLPATDELLTLKADSVAIGEQGA